MNYDAYMDNFDAKKVKDDIVKWIRNWFNENGTNCKAIIGISGGKDSTVVAGLCVEALGKDRVIGVLMPNGEQHDINDANAVVNHLGIAYTKINIKDAYDGICRKLGGIFKHDDATFIQYEVSNQTKINLPPRLRMATLYAVSQSLNGRVANTCNLSEDYIGYSTRFGDSVGDFSPLATLTTDEVVAIGKACGFPTELVEKVPADGLCGKTDEDNIGFSYKILNKYIRTGICEDAKIKSLIDAKHNNNKFKLQPIPRFEF